MASFYAIKRRFGLTTSVFINPIIENFQAQTVQVYYIAASFVDTDLWSLEFSGRYII